MCCLHILSFKVMFELSFANLLKPLIKAKFIGRSSTTVGTLITPRELFLLTWCPILPLVPPSHPSHSLEATSTQLFQVSLPNVV